MQQMLMYAKMLGLGGTGSTTGALGTAAGVAGKAAMGPLGWGMLAAQAVPTAINLAQAISQKKKASDFSKTQRPQYEIPQGVLDAVNQSKYLASMRELPGQNLMEGRLGQNTAKGIAEMKNVAANPADLASNVARMYGAQNDAINNIGVQAGQNWLGQQGQLNQALNRLGQYQQQQWDYNKNQPYQNAMAAASALREGAFRNTMAAGTNIASGISGGLNMQNQQNMMDAYLNRFAPKENKTIPDITNNNTNNNTSTGGPVLYNDKPASQGQQVNLTQAVNNPKTILYGYDGNIPQVPAFKTSSSQASTNSTLKPIDQMTPAELNSEYNALNAKSKGRTTQEEERFYELTKAIYR